MNSVTVITFILIMAAKSQAKTGIKYINNIIKSPEDKRLYRGLILPNQLRVLLISDPKTDKSQATLLVDVGSLSDPDDLQGLAHFCEHMLFMGSEKYPIENEYDKFISDHGGGYPNAMTDYDFTSYFFQVASEHLNGALDIFAQFLISPLMTKDSVDREVNAVHSEYLLNKARDKSRFTELLHSLSKKGHPYGKFQVGSKMALANIPKEKGIDVRDELLKFHEKWYSANLMTLIVLGKESLEELEKMIVPIFSEIKNKNVTRPEWPDHPFGPDQIQSKTYLIPLMDIKKLYILFPIPDLRTYYKTNPMKYINSLLNDKGAGSLISELKLRNWANQLLAEPEILAKGFNFFSIEVDLTSDGIEKVDEIITLIFQYLNLLRESGIQKWIFEEFQKISEMDFRFRDNEDFINKLAEDFHKFEYPFEEVLIGSHVMTEYKPDVIRILLNCLKPSNIQVTVVGKTFEGVTDKIEPWYGSKYKFEKIPGAVIRKWENCGVSNELKLPSPNEFIPSNFDISFHGEKDSRPKHPIIIHESNFSRIWFKQDDQFLLPKTNLKCIFISPVVYSDCFNHSLTKLFIEMVKDVLDEYSYPANLAGVSYKMQVEYYGFTLHIKGFSDKQDIFLDKILKKMTLLQIDPKRFYVIKEKLIKKFKNNVTSDPEQQFWSHFLALYRENDWSLNERLEAMEQIKLEDIKKFIPRFFSKLFVECLIHGNVDEKAANSYTEILEHQLISNISKPLSPHELLSGLEIALNNGENAVLEAENELEGNSFIGIYYQCGVPSTENNIKVELLHQITQEPTEDILRTKEQLGYSVWSDFKRDFGAQGWMIFVQSEKHPKFLDQRIEVFLVYMRQAIQDMSDEKFDQHKEALSAKRLAKPKNLFELNEKFWEEIVYRKYNFDRDEIEVAYLRNITKADFLKFFDDHIKEGGSKRRKLSIHIISKVRGAAGTLPGTNFEFFNGSAVAPEKIENVGLFKRSHRFYSPPEPHVDISYFRTNKLSSHKYDNAFCRKPYSTSVAELICMLLLD